MTQFSHDGSETDDLVMADWLEDQGRHEEAAELRDQIDRGPEDPEWAYEYRYRGVVGVGGVGGVGVVGVGGVGVVGVGGVDGVGVGVVGGVGGVGVGGVGVGGVGVG